MTSLHVLTLCFEYNEHFEERKKKSHLPNFPAYYIDINLLKSIICTYTQ